MEHREVRKLLATNLTWMLTHAEPIPHVLRPYQREALVAMTDWLNEAGGTKRAYIQHATGLGKTVLFAAMARYAIGLRLLIIVPSKVLVVQTARVLHGYVGGMLGHLTSLGDIEDREGRIICRRGHEAYSVVLTTDASMRRHAESISRDYAPHIVIRDECHWGYSPSSQKALGAFQEALILGLSATPDYLSTVNRPHFVPVTIDHGYTLYGDPKRFAKTHLHTRLDVRTARWGMDNGYLCPLNWGQIRFDANLEKVRLIDGPGGLDYDPSELQKAMARSWPKTCHVLSELYRDPETALLDRQAFAVCPGVKAAEQLASAIRTAGVPAYTIHGKTPEREREALLAAFERKEIPFLASVLVLREGWDSPNADVCFMLRPTRSRVYYEQPIGRILRLPPDRPDKVALAIDLHVQSASFAPLSAPDLYGKLGEVYGGADGRPIAEPADRQAEKAIPEPLRAERHKVTGPDIEHWAGPDETFAANGLTWASMEALSRIYRIGLGPVMRVLHDHADSVRRRRAKTRYGRPDMFYCIEDTPKLFGPIKVSPLARTLT